MMKFIEKTLSTRTQVYKHGMKDITSYLVKRKLEGSRI